MAAFRIRAERYDPAQAKTGAAFSGALGRRPLRLGLLCLHERAQHAVLENRQSPHAGLCATAIEFPDMSLHYHLVQSW